MKFLKYLFAQRRVRDLRMKLDAVNTACRVFDSGDDIAGRRGCLKAVGQTGHMVAVAHPDVEFEREFVE